MVTAVIVQARMQSTRFPGKVLMEIEGRTVLSHVIERCLAIRNADVVCCAIPDTRADDPVAAEAESNGVAVIRGSESDLLDRYRKAAEAMRADVVLRITSDCPALDPAVCDDVLTLQARAHASYACNTLPPAWPDGLDCEAISREWLERAWREANSPFEREHVGPYIRSHKDAQIAVHPCPEGDLRRCRWTLDTAEDLRFLRILFARLPGGPSGWSWRAALDVVRADPSLARINAMHVR